jgi:protein-disulfide isomerase
MMRSYILFIKKILSMKMNTKNILWGVITFLVIIGGLWGVWNLTTQPAGTPKDKKVDLTVTAADHIMGPENAQVTLVEYSDFQCPACRAYAPLVKSIVEKNPETVRLVYRHFPLDQHTFAKQAAYAAEAAGKQGKFFEFHNILFDKQEDWQEGKNLDKLFSSYAQELKLNVKQFKTDSASSEVKAAIERDIKSGIQFQVDATPTFFLNGTRIENPGSLDDFQKLIDTAVGAPQATQAAEPSPTATQ